MLNLSFSAACKSQDLRDKQVDQWKEIFPNLFKYGRRRENAKTIINEIEEIQEKDIKQITAIPDELFFGCTNLTRLEFNKNKIRLLPPGIFNECPALKVIHFSDNQLAIIPDSLLANCRALKELNFSNNQLAKIPDGLFGHCPTLEVVNFEKNQLSLMQAHLFDNCHALKEMNFSNNQLAKLPDSLFSHCPSLKHINFNYNQLSLIPYGLFDKCPALEKMYLSNNQLTKIPDRLFDNCPALKEIKFNYNQLALIPDGLFDSCCVLEGTKFNSNRLFKIPANLFGNCPALKWINFNCNQLTKIPDGFFNNCRTLEFIRFSNNQLSFIPDALFDTCPALECLDFNNNQLLTIPDGLFDKCFAVTKILFSNNQLSKIPESLYKSHICFCLEVVDFSANRIKLFNGHLFGQCDKLRSLNLEKNNIEVVSFRSLEPFSNCSDINLRGNFFFNSKSLYSLMFQHCFSKDKDLQRIFNSYFKKYRNVNFFDSKFYIIRNFDNNLVENSFLAFFLTSSAKTSMSIKSLKTKFDFYSSRLENSFSFDFEFSLLDLFISVFGEIDDSKVINLKKHIDQLILKDENLGNIEFLIRSEKTVRNLCMRNISSHFEAFFTNTFSQLISRVHKTYAKAEDLNSEEEFAFKSFCQYVAIKRDPKEIIFHLIEYTECFNISLRNKNHEIAKCVVSLLRYYVMVWNDFTNVVWTKDLTVFERAECSKRAQSALKKFNRNLFDQFEFMFENDLVEIITFLLDIKKLDQIKPVQNKSEFLEYDLNRFDSKQTDPDCCLERAQDGQKKKEFLQFARDCDDILKHESVKRIFREKWREKAAIKYYFDLLMFIVFVVFYTIYIESNGKSDVDDTFQLSAWYISLVLAIINLILEVFQCFMHIIYGKFSQYITR